MFQSIVSGSPSPFPFQINGEQLLLTGLKFGFLFFFVLFVIFAVIVVRQIKLMSQTISNPTDSILSIVGWVYLGATVFVLLLAFFTL